MLYIIYHVLHLIDCISYTPHRKTLFPLCLALETTVIIHQWFYGRLTPHTSCPSGPGLMPVTVPKTKASEADPPSVMPRRGVATGDFMGKFTTQLLWLSTVMGIFSDEITKSD